MNFADFVLLDASSPNAVVAAKLDQTGRAWQAFCVQKSPALEGIFDAISQVAPGFCGNGFLFCEGPGSILGIRIAAMALRGNAVLARGNVACGNAKPRLGNGDTLVADSKFCQKVDLNSGDKSVAVPKTLFAESKEICGNAKPIFAFQSLALAGTLLLRAGTHPPFVVLAESRMNRWNIFRVPASLGNSENSEFSELTTAELSTIAEPIFAFPLRRAGTLPVPATFIDLAELLRADPAVFADVPALLRPTSAPDAVNTAAVSTYIKWTPERHHG